MTKEEQVQIDAMFAEAQTQSNILRLRAGQLAGQNAVLKMQLEEATKKEEPKPEVEDAVLVD